MARWTELSYNKHYSRNNEIEKEINVEDDYVEELFSYDEEQYGIIEKFNVKNCYAVEDVYNGLDEWN